MIKPISRISIGVFTTLVGLTCWANAPKPDGSRAEAYRTQVESVFQTIENYYGPLQMKEKAIGLNWSASKDHIRQKLPGIQNSRDFYFMMSDLLSSFNDAHVSIQLPSTLETSIPMSFVVVENKFLVNSFDEAVMNESQCLVEIGDELLAYNGQNLIGMSQSNTSFMKYGNDLTNTSMFARILSNSKEQLGMRMTSELSDQVTLQLRKSKSSESQREVTCKIPVTRKGVGLITRNIPGLLKRNLSALEKRTSDYSEFKSSISEIFSRPPFNQTLTERDMRKLFKLERQFAKFAQLLNASVPQLEPSGSKSAGGMKTRVGTPIEIGQQSPFFKLPDDFERIDPGLAGYVINGSSLFAGTFNSNGKRVGFLRIPSYLPQLPLTMCLGLRYYIQKLEEKSDFLIVDQTNNPGGYVAYSDLMVKAFIKTYSDDNHVKFAVKPTQSFLRSYAELIDEIKSSEDTGFEPGELQTLVAALEEGYQRIYAAFQNRKDLSEPVSMLPISQYFERSLDVTIKSLPFADLIETVVGANILTEQVYTKPVYMLINELDFSGGDATPASLQDYGRVKLIGTRTAGAGGSVEQFYNFGVESFAYQLTTSLMVRKGGRLIENYGVQPDIEFSVLQTDVHDGYTSYFARLLKLVESDMNRSTGSGVRAVITGNRR